MLAIAMVHRCHDLGRTINVFPLLQLAECVLVPQKLDHGEEAFRTDSALIIQVLHPKCAVS